MKRYIYINVNDSVYECAQTIKNAKLRVKNIIHYKPKSKITIDVYTYSEQGCIYNKWIYNHKSKKTIKIETGIVS